MNSTLTIDAVLLSKLLQYGEFDSAEEAVEAAMRAFIARRARATLLERHGRFDLASEPVEAFAPVQPREMM